MNSRNVYQIRVKFYFFFQISRKNLTERKILKFPHCMWCQVGIFFLINVIMFKKMIFILSWYQKKKRRRLGLRCIWIARSKLQVGQKWKWGCWIREWTPTAKTRRWERLICIFQLMRLSKFVLVAKPAIQLKYLLILVLIMEVSTSSTYRI